MFTIEQIKSAHSKVSSGADFPKYIQEIKSLGVKNYETFVADGQTVFNGSDGYFQALEKKYKELTIAEDADGHQFIQDLKNHQAGNSDYMTFCMDCAKSGIMKWIVNTEKMTCAYYDKNSNEIYIEDIPK